MTAFSYSARRSSGELVTGSAEAASRIALKAQLAGEGLLLVEARPVRRTGLPTLRPDRVPLPALLAFLREFRHLVDAGLPVAAALQILKERPEERVLGSAIATVHGGVQRGLALDEAAAARPDVFDEVVRATLRAGVLTGRLGDALLRLETFLALRAAMARKIRRALVYPSFLLGLLAFVLAVLMLFVLPRFNALYEEFGEELPAPTRLLMDAVETAPFWIPGGLVAAALAVFVWKRAMQATAARRRRDAWALQSPIVGRILRDSALMQLSYMLAMLLRAGAPLREALEFGSDSMSNAVIRMRLETVLKGIDAGRSLSDGIADTALFPASSTSMIRAGELSGALPDLLDAVGRVHEDALGESLDRLLALVEPVMILFVGSLLGAIIIAVYLPVFGVSGVVQ